MAKLSDGKEINRINGEKIILTSDIGEILKIGLDGLLANTFKDNGSVIQDLNNLKVSGIYYTNGDTINAAITGPLLVFRTGPAVIQISFSVFGSEMFIRSLLYNDAQWNLWTEWRQL